jgi:glutamate 5-kinase
MAFFSSPRGEIEVDSGAVTALQEKKSSLLAKGVRKASGQISAGQLVRILGPQKREIGCGISTFSRAELESILGKSSSEVRQLFPDRRTSTVVHRDGLVLRD